MKKTAKTYSYKVINSPVGDLKLVASEKGLAAILWPKEDPRRVHLGRLTEEPNNPILQETERQLGACSGSSGVPLGPASDHACLSFRSGSEG